MILSIANQKKTFYLIGDHQFLYEITTHCPKKIIQKETKILKQTKQELEEYFLGNLKHFTIPLSFSGTIFQNKVWEALKNIPYGTTVSYKYLAEKIGQPKAARAVGRAVHKNPLPFILPCHRVVGTSGSLTGYALGIDIKKWLLKLECKEKKIDE